MKNKYLRFLTKFLAIFVIGLQVCYSSSQKGLEMPICNIEANVILAKKGDVEAAARIAHMAIEHSEKIDDNELKRIASLLDSPIGLIRLWAAAAVGNFGSRATTFAPRLQQIVSEESCNMTGLSSADAAHAALKKIGITPVPFGCKNHK